MPNNSKDLINLLIEKRKQLKLTQNKLAKKVDVSHTTIARIETKEMNPTLSLFISLANELGYDLTLQKINENHTNLETENDIKTTEEVLKQVINKLGYETINNNIFDKDVLVLKKTKDIRK